MNPCAFAVKTVPSEKSTRTKRSEHLAGARAKRASGRSDLEQLGKPALAERPHRALRLRDRDRVEVPEAPEIEVADGGRGAAFRPCLHQPCGVANVADLVA